MTDDVAELVRRVRANVWDERLVGDPKKRDWISLFDVLLGQARNLADACERLAVEKVQLRLALKLLRDSLRVMPLDDGRLYFDDDFDAANFIENILKQTEQS